MESNIDEIRGLLDSMEEELSDLHNQIQSAEGEMQSVGLSSFDSFSDLVSEFVKQKNRIAELENSLDIESHRLTQAWKRISELTKTTSEER